MYQSICASATSVLLSLAILLGGQLRTVAATEDPEITTLYLEVFINETPSRKIAAFVERPDGSLATSREELNELGLASEATATADDGLVDLARLPWLSYQYDRSAQTIRLAIDQDRLPLHVVDGRRSGDDLSGAAQSGRGAVLNYTIHGTLDDGDSALGAGVEARAFGRYGNFSQSTALKLAGDNGFEAVRLDTTWTASNPSSMITWRGGDIISGGLPWTRPVRMGGLQMQRNFALRGDLVTMPIPEFGGSALVPSTVEVYANNVRLVAEDVPAGPFSVTNLPIVSGAGTARIVVRDASGRATETNQVFFASSALLKKGLTDFSLEGGFPRRSFGTRSTDYDKDIALAATLRHGITNRLTIEAHTEMSADLVNLGVGAVAPVGGFGIADIAVAGSTGSGTGGLINLGLNLEFDRVGLRLRSSRTFGDYADIASTSAETTESDTDFIDAAHPRAIDQIGLSFPLLSDSSGATVSLARIRSAAGDENVLASLSYSRRLFGDSTFYLQGFHSFDGGGGSGLHLGLSRPLNGGLSASANTSLSDEGAAGGLELAKAGGRGVGSHAWRVAGGVGDTADLRASATYRAPFASATTRLRGSSDGLFASAEITGAIAATGGGVYLAERIDDAFAVVDAGASDVMVYSENRPVGRTNRAGKILIAGLRSWQANKLSIEPNDMPLDVEPESTELAVVPKDGAGVVVDFGATSTSHAAIIVLRDRAGAFIPPGTPVRLASGEEAVVGYDGQAYLRTLARSNTLVATLDTGSDCQAAFEFREGLEAQALIDNVVCQ